MRFHRPDLICILVLSLAGCGESSTAATQSATATATATADAKSAAAAPGSSAAPSAVGLDSVEVRFLEQYQSSDAPGSLIPTFKITNRSSKKLHFISAWHYYYDKDGKQLGRRFAERTVGTIEPGASHNLGFGFAQSEMPPDTKQIEAVLVGANFEGGLAIKGDAKTLAPEQRALGGGGSGSSAAAGDASTAPSAAAVEDYAGLTGSWLNDGWGVVKIDGSSGTYTDTYGGGKGTMEFTKTGERTFSVKWGESKARHGTMSVTLSEDGRKLTGTWKPDSDVTIGDRSGGSVAWTKR